jgi:oligopeptide transport system permease protein
VTTLIGEGIPYTATLGGLAFLIIVPLGIGIGGLAALRQNTRSDCIAMGFATAAASFPNFVVGALMVVVFSVEMARWTGHAFFLPAADFGADDHLIMPVITLALLPIDSGRHDARADVCVPGHRVGDRGDCIQHPGHRPGVCVRGHLA